MNDECAAQNDGSVHSDKKEHRSLSIVAGNIRACQWTQTSTVIAVSKRLLMPAHLALNIAPDLRSHLFTHVCLHRFGIHLPSMLSRH